MLRYLSIILNFVMLIILLCHLAFASTVLKAEIDKKSINIEDVLTYKIIIESEERRLPPLNFPSFENFEVVYQQQTSSLSFIKDKPRIKISYIFLLKPLKTGKLKIGSAYLKINKDTYSTEEFEIEVKGDDNKIPLPQEPKKDIPIIEGEKIIL